MSLTIFNSDSRELQMLQNSWSSILNPLISNPLMNGIFLKNIALINGATVINHLLARVQQGYILTDINGAATVYRSQALNAQTLTLTSNAAVTVSIYVF